MRRRSRGREGRERTQDPEIYQSDHFSTARHSVACRTRAHCIYQAAQQRLLFQRLRVIARSATHARTRHTHNQACAPPDSPSQARFQVAHPCPKLCASCSPDADSAGISELAGFSPLNVRVNDPDNSASLGWRAPAPTSSGPHPNRWRRDPRRRALRPVPRIGPVFRVVVPNRPAFRAEDSAP